MFEIDKQQFGKFVAQLRKEKGLKQKELAELLCISDKAISKWETGHSVPDITLLVPLSEILGVTVTELLECRRIESSESLTAKQTDALVKRVIDLSEEEQVHFFQRRKKQIFIYLICVGIAIIELFVLYQFESINRNGYLATVGVLLGLTVGFGCYFWIFIKEKLPFYYDENKINVYVDGILHMNLPGVYFNNHNWPHIVKVLRIWSAVGMTIFIPIYVLLCEVFPIGIFWELFLLLGFMLGGMFLPILIVARKYQNIESTETIENATNFYHKEKNTKKNTIIILIFVAGILLFIAFVNSLGVGTFRSATSIAFLSKETKTYWSASYAYLNGTIRRNFWIEKENRNDIKINVKTEEGMLGIEIEDLDGNMIFSKEDVGTNIFEVPIKDEEKVVIRIKAEKHKGSFVVE